MSGTRVLLITSVLSPFWVEFAEQATHGGRVLFFVAFLERGLAGRGPHWANFDSDQTECFRYDGSGERAWVLTIIKETQPDLVLCGMIRSTLSQRIAIACRKLGVGFGYVSEQPEPAGLVTATLKRLAYRYYLWRSRPDILLAIGDRAATTYGELSAPGTPVVFFPYYQALKADLDRTIHTSSPGTIRFVFSGQLIKRNAILETALAFERLAAVRTGCFTWVIAGKGPEEGVLFDVLDRCAALKSAVRFDNEFATWDDRLRPFRSGDVLVCAGKHSGWGLVVPEALSNGCMVISSHYVEAARYYVEEMVNGMLVAPTAAGIFDSLLFCVDHPDAVAEMRGRSKASVAKGDVEVGIARLTLILERYLAQGDV